ncbi:Type II secretion system protein D precursor [Roseivivax sp. THAF40]|uniref:type II and III secretion system protein family protein n=1 Tax=unclassified Roseivivax TaxID=2639302 RepID=UPI00126793AB|nr:MULTISPECIES: type II and III secretion system protein family protein [unclassified Roseivivax]QFS81865.1 Type II secretion system protein D precursor [Roseivivax sp. THAF197b]QFT45665.1 Type II secretion system protein D precursor [Roseivivax sp. THAF40]
MKFDGILRAALLGSVLGFAPIATPVAEAQDLRIVRGNVGSQLSVAINRALVVESDIPFAEISIANPAIADISSLSDRSIYVLGRAPGTTTMSIFDAEGMLIANVDVRVAADISEFKERLRQILPGEPIEVRTANDGIVLSGTLSSIQALDRALSLAERYAPERVSNLMQVGGVQQVMLKVRFAEMQRSVSKALRSSLSIGGDLLGGDAGLVSETGTWLDGNTLGDPVAFGNDTEGGAVIGFDAGGLEVGILLEALESKGLVRMLAEPNLTALSGQEASFLAGGEYPVPVQAEGDQISIEFKPFGVELDFIPRVIDGDLINLELKTAVSSLDSTTGIDLQAVRINGFSRREASTTVELRDGESFAIAGLLQDDFRDLNGQVPWLGDIPVLGALFRSAEYSREQSELVIIVTPHLVTPTRGEALALPTDKVRPPSERDLFLFGKTQAGERRRPSSGAAGEVATQDFTGSYGYVMD